MAFKEGAEVSLVGVLDDHPRDVSVQTDSEDANEIYVVERSQKTSFVLKRRSEAYGKSS